MMFVGIAKDFDVTSTKTLILSSSAYFWSCRRISTGRPFIFTSTPVDESGRKKSIIPFSSRYSLIIGTPYFSNNCIISFWSRFSFVISSLELRNNEKILSIRIVLLLPGYVIGDYEFSNFPSAFSFAADSPRSFDITDATGRRSVEVIKEVIIFICVFRI